MCTARGQRLEGDDVRSFSMIEIMNILDSHFSALNIVTSCSLGHAYRDDMSISIHRTKVGLR